MASENINERIRDMEEFIKESIIKREDLQNRINDGTYSKYDIYEGNVTEYYITGMFLMMDILKLECIIIKESKFVSVSIKDKGEGVLFDVIESNVKKTLKRVREIQIEAIDAMRDKIEKNGIDEMSDIEQDVKYTIYINVLYGMKIIAHFMGLELDGRYGIEETLSILDKNLKNEKLTLMRRELGEIYELVKEKRTIIKRLKVNETLKRILNIKMKRFDIAKELLSKDAFAIYEKENKYIIQKESMQKVALLKSKEEVADAHDKVDKVIKDMLYKYAGIGEGYGDKDIKE